MTNYIYIQSEPSLFTVGFYEPDKTWVAESNHNTANEAAARVSFLNGNAFEAQPGVRKIESNKLERYPVSIESLQLAMLTKSERLASIKAQLDALDDDLTEKVIAATNKETGKPLFTNEQARGVALRRLQLTDPLRIDLAESLQTLEASRLKDVYQLERLRASSRSRSLSGAVKSPQ